MIFLQHHVHHPSLKNPARDPMAGFGAPQAAPTPSGDLMLLRRQPHDLLEDLRKAAPLVQCIQNGVAMDISANAMLAIGASPAMVCGVDESPDFMKKAAALSINTGTLTETRVAEIHKAVAAAQQYKKPWSLDPVGCGGTPYRTKQAAAIMAMRPDVVRGNASEIMALACECMKLKLQGGGGKGVDSTAKSEEALALAVSLSRSMGSIVAVSGETDLITDGRVVVRVSNGVQMLTRITAVGCSLSAIVSAFLAVAPGMALEAAVAAHACVALCGEGCAGIISRRPLGPGTLRMLWIDKLSQLLPADLRVGARIAIVAAPEGVPLPAAADVGPCCTNLPAVKAKCEWLLHQCLFHPFVALCAAGAVPRELIEAFQAKAAKVLALIDSPRAITAEDCLGHCAATRRCAMERYAELVADASEDTCQVTGAPLVVAAAAAWVHCGIRDAGRMGGCEGWDELVEVLERRAGQSSRMVEEAVAAYYARSLELQLVLLDEAAIPAYLPAQYAAGVAAVSSALGGVVPPRHMSMVPKVLIVAGSDSGGGAGIQADIKACEAMGAFSMTAIAALTAQNTLGVQGVHGTPPEFIALQIKSCLDDIGCDVIKTGMIASRGACASLLASAGWRGAFLWVVDPVMVSTSGHALIDGDAITAIREGLFPLAHIITPNLPEAELLVGHPIAGRQGMEEACRELATMGPKWVLVKGGHMERCDEAIDVLYHAGTKTFSHFASAMVESSNTHGTGCTLASSIAAGLAKGLTTPEAVAQAKRYVWGAIKHSADIAVGRGHGPLFHAYEAGGWRIPPARLLSAPRRKVAVYGGRRVDYTIYAVTDEDCCAAQGVSIMQAVADALRGGATVVQLRLKTAQGGEMLRRAAELLPLCREAGVPLLINDRLDIAVAVGADGAHVGQDDVDCESARRVLGPHRIVGVSCKTVALALKAQQDGADYIGCGAVFGTGTKDTTVIGVEGLRAVCSGCDIPVVAIGGLKADNVAEAIRAGAVGVALVSAIFNKKDIAGATRELKQAVLQALA